VKVINDVDDGLAMLARRTLGTGSAEPRG